MQSLIKKIPKNAVILDCSYYLNEPQKALQLYSKRRIPNARFYDLDLYSNKLSSFPHMLPTPIEFQNSMQELGIQKEDHVVCYDQSMFSAPRVWWTLKQYGHEKVSVLDGGLKKYELDGLPLVDTPSVFTKSEYPLPTPQDLKIDYSEFITSITDYTRNDFQLLDARSEGRFGGYDPEPRPVPSGHCPTAKNIPYTTLLQPDGCLLELKELEKVFKGVNLEQPIVTMCGSGVTACTLYLGLELLKAKNVRVYDGSWSEYAFYKNSPIVRYP